MIKYVLRCSCHHEFEAWFGGSDDFDQQSDADLVVCPVCQGTDVRKAIMAPAVRASKRSSGPDEMMTSKQFHEFAAQIRQHVQENCEYVGGKFTQEAQDINAGESPSRNIYGEASPAQAKSLREEGVPVALLPEPFAPIPEKNLN